MVTLILRAFAPVGGQSESTVLTPVTPFPGSEIGGTSLS